MGIHGGRNSWRLMGVGFMGVSEGNFNKPHCLAVNKARNLMVCDSMNHRIQVFDLDGNFVAIGKRVMFVF